MGHAVVPGEIDVSHGTILYLEDVTVSFDGFRALNALTLSIDVGELRCIIGPNGAGKTTMMDVITGKTEPDGGKVFLGQTIDLTRMIGAVDRACGHRPQVPEADGVRAASGVGKPRTRDEDRQGLVGLVARAAGSRGAGADRGDAGADSVWRARRRRLAGELSHGQKQRLEIGMLLMQQPALLLLDEPAAGMTDRRDHATRRVAQQSARHLFDDGRRA